VAWYFLISRFMFLCSLCARWIYSERLSSTTCGEKAALHLVINDVHHLLLNITEIDVINRMLAVIVKFCEQVCIELGLLVRLVLWTFSCGNNNILTSVHFDHQLLQRNLYVHHTWMVVLILFAQNVHITNFVF
jgi:hypothetical protein